MKGILLENVSRSSIVSFSKKNSGEICLAWMSASFDDVISSLPEDVIFGSDEMSHCQLDLPWISGSKQMLVTTTIVRVKNNKILEYMAEEPWGMLASGDLVESDLVEFYRDELCENYGSLNWYSSMIGRIEKISLWSIWSGLPDPLEVGSKFLVVVQRSEDVYRFLEDFQEIIESERLLCGAAGFLGTGLARVSIIDARDELLKVARRNS